MPVCIKLHSSTKHLPVLWCLAGNVYDSLPESSVRSVSIVLMIIHQAFAYAMFILPVHHMWEKLIKTHDKPYWVRLPSRLPVGELSTAHMCIHYLLVALGCFWFCVQPAVMVAARCRLFSPFFCGVVAILGLGLQYAQVQPSVAVLACEDTSWSAQHSGPDSASLGLYTVCVSATHCSWFHHFGLCLVSLYITASRLCAGS